MGKEENVKLGGREAILGAGAAVGDFFAGAPIFTLSRILAQVRSRQESLSVPEAGKRNDVPWRKLLRHKMNEAATTSSALNVDKMHGFQTSIRQAETVPEISRNDVRSAILHPTLFGETFGYGSRIITTPDKKIHSEMPDLSSISVSCATIFPLCLASLYSLRLPERYSANFILRDPSLFGHDQIHYDLSSESPNAPALLITANASFFFLGKSYERFLRYRLLKAVHFVNTFRLVRPRKISSLRRKKSTAFFRGTVAEQHLRATEFPKQSIGFDSFQDFFKNPGNIGHDEIIAWEPLASVLRAAGWRVVPRGDFQSPVSIFVDKRYLSKEMDSGADKGVLWLVRAFLNEFEMLARDLDRAEAVLLAQRGFADYFNVHVPSG